jgi:hypothetical protein
MLSKLLKVMEKSPFLTLGAPAITGAACLVLATVFQQVTGINITKPIISNEQVVWEIIIAFTLFVATISCFISGMMATAILSAAGDDNELYTQCLVWIGSSLFGTTIGGVEIVVILIALLNTASAGAQ